MINVTEVKATIVEKKPCVISGENKNEKSRCHFEKYINHEIFTALEKKHETEGQPLTNHFKIFSISRIELG